MDEEKLAILKEKALKCKVIALDILQHNPLSNPSNMNPREKKKVIKMMETWFKKKDSEIDEEFNDIVNNKILHYVFDFLILFSGNRQIPGLPVGARIGASYRWTKSKIFLVKAARNFMVSAEIGLLP